MSEPLFLVTSYLLVINQHDKIYLQKIGLRISKLRLQQKLSKVQLAFEINTSESNIIRIEKGQINVGLITLKKIPEALHISLSDFFSEIE